MDADPHDPHWCEALFAARAAMRHLAGLPREQREVIVLKIWHRHTFEEIGELLGISPNTASGRYRYGLIRLRAALGGTPTHEPDESTAALRRGLFPLDAAPAVGGA